MTSAVCVRRLNLLATLVVATCVALCTGCAPAPVEQEVAQMADQVTEPADVNECIPKHILSIRAVNEKTIVDPCPLKVFTGDCVQFSNEIEQEVTVTVPEGIFDQSPGKIGPGDSVFVTVVKTVESDTDVVYTAGDAACWDINEATPRIIIRATSSQ